MHADYRFSHTEKGPIYDESIFASAFERYMDIWEAHHVAGVLPRLFPDDRPRYLDFACGTGRMTQRLEAFAAESWGVDISESMLEAARAKCLSTRFLRADLTRETVDLGQFDLVTAFRFFGNAQDELRSSALTAIHRQLRPGGYLIINNHRNPICPLSAWRRLHVGVQEMDLSILKLTRLLRSHRFELVHQRAIGFWLWRHAMAQPRYLESAVASRLECLFQFRAFVPFAPDAVLVARKASEAA